MKKYLLSVCSIILSIIFTTNWAHGQTPFWKSIATPKTSGGENLAAKEFKFDKDGVLYMTTSEGVYKTSDRGLTIQSVGKPSGSTSVNSIDWDSLGQLLVATDIGIFRRKGSQWENLNDQLPSKKFHSVHSAKNGLIFAGTTVQQIYRSTDNGVSWQLKGSGIDVGGSYSVISRITSSPNGYLYAAGEYGTYLSTNQGESWERIPLIPSYRQIYYYDSVIALVGRGAAWISLDYGKTFSQINTALSTKYPDDYFLSLALNSKKELFLGSSFFGGGGKLFKSSDFGSSWKYMNGDGNLQVIICDSLDYLYAARSSSGLYRSLSPVLHTTQVMHYPDSLRLSVNPAHSSTVASIYCSEPAFASIYITDIHGKVVQQYTSRWITSEKQDIELDLSNISNGVYAVLVDTRNRIYTSKLIVTK